MKLGLAGFSRFDKFVKLNCQIIFRFCPIVQIETSSRKLGKCGSRVIVAKEKTLSENTFWEFLSLSLELLLKGVRY